MDVVRIGMVGARFGAALHLQNLAPLRGERVEIVGVCSVNRESAEACARRFEIPFVTTDFAALLARSDVDAVDLCIPPALHHTFAVQAAEGLHDQDAADPRGRGEAIDDDPLAGGEPPLRDGPANVLVGQLFKSAVLLDGGEDIRKSLAGGFGRLP